MVGTNPGSGHIWGPTETYLLWPHIPGQDFQFDPFVLFLEHWSQGPEDPGQRNRD